MTYNVLYGLSPTYFFSLIWYHVPTLSAVTLLFLLRAWKSLSYDILFLLLIMTFIPTMPHFTTPSFPSLFLPILPV